MLLLDIKHHYKNYLLIFSACKQVEQIIIFSNIILVNIFTSRSCFVRNMHDLELARINSYKIEII
jgi:hypothetical protein